MSYLKHVFAIAGVSVLTMSAYGARYEIGNGLLKRTFEVENKKLTTVSLDNYVSGKSVKLNDSQSFRLRISAGTETEGTDRIISAKDFVVTDVAENKNTITFSLQNELEGLSVNVTYFQKAGEPYLRKKLTIRASKKVCVERVDIDSLAMEDLYQPYKEKKITSKAPRQWKPGLGQPLFTAETALFMGTEFPASYNYLENGRYFCGYLYGHLLQPEESFTTYPAIVGAGDDAEYIRDTFYDYITAIRVRPLRLQTQYNSWFDYGRGVTKENFRKSTATVHRELCEKRGVTPLKAYVIDDGWQDSKKGCDWSDGAWPINTKFTRNFAYSHETINNASSQLGLWMSPGCNFGARPAVPHMREKGWGALGSYMSLANSTYMDMLETRMVELTQQGVSYFKLDGLFGHLNIREYDLDGASRGVPAMPQLGTKDMSPSDPELNDSKYDEAKIYYLTVGAERMMKIFAAMAQYNPEVYIVISNGAWLSPWWLMHCDSVWMINAGDAAKGSGRTEELVYRDGVYHQLAEQEQTMFPINALFNHEPKKTANNETKDTFRKYLYMNMSRGTGFVELYLKTFRLAEYDWDVLAEGLIWVEDVFPTFSRARMHGGDPNQGDIYGYTAWLEDRGYVSLHNPSQKAQQYSFTLNRQFGLFPRDTRFKLTSPLADSLENLKQEYSYGETIRLTLNPGEIRILNFDTKVKDWNRLIALQTRTEQDFSPKAAKTIENVIIQPDGEYIGVWQYTHAGATYSREFTGSGKCILRKGDKVLWKRSYRVTADGKARVGGEVHSFKGTKMAVGPYKADKIK